MSEIYDIVVVGMGASGLFAMANLESKLNVLGLDSQKKAGQKLKLTGGGRCNLTNTENVKHLVKQYTDSSFVRPIIYGFNNEKTIEYFEKIGLKIKEEQGKIYPLSNNAEDVTKILLAEIEKKKHKIKYNEKVCDIKFCDDCIEVLGQNNVFKSRSVIIATGGASYLKTGSTGELLRKVFGCKEFESGLSQIYIKENVFRNVACVNVKVKLKYKKQNFDGEMLVVGNMLTGPEIMNLSNYIDKGESFFIDFIPYITAEELKNQIVEKGSDNPKKLLKTILSELLDLPESILRSLLEELKIEKIKMAELKGKDLNKFINSCKFKEFRVEGKCPLDKATVSLGGISLTDVDNGKMCWKKDERVYVIGEALDVVGNCGGYNLQFAFSSAYRVAKYLNK